jgi:hypothetical protein
MRRLLIIAGLMFMLTGCYATATPGVGYAYGDVTWMGRPSRLRRDLSARLLQRRLGLLGQRQLVLQLRKSLGRVPARASAALPLSHVLGSACVPIAARVPHAIAAGLSSSACAAPARLPDAHARPRLSAAAARSRALSRSAALIEHVVQCF